MSAGFTACLVPIAAYCLICLMLSMAVAGAAAAGLRPASANGLFVLRLLPAGGAALLALTVVLPAFLAHEPVHESEPVGPLLWASAMGALTLCAAGGLRGVRAWWTARVLYRRYAPSGRREVAGVRFVVVDVDEPVVAVIGGWSSRIVAARHVVAACSDEELRQVLAHERAHVAACDNLKLLLLTIVPDPLAWMTAGATLLGRWRIAVEFEADERAAGPDRRNRMALASALIKVARMAAQCPLPRAAIAMPVVSDDVAGRVLRLLEPSPPRVRALTAGHVVVVLAVALPLVAVPLYAHIHRLLEALVSFGS